jgi:hypothetical protein
VVDQTEKREEEKEVEPKRKPHNPLAATVAEQRRAYESLSQQLSVIMIRLQGILEVENTSKTQGTGEMVRSTESLLEKIHDEIERLKLVESSQSKKLEAIESWHLRILRQLQVFFGVKQFEGKLGVIDEISELVDEISAQFMPVKVVNEGTVSLRKLLEVEESTFEDYMLEIERKVSVLMNSLAVVRSFDEPLRDFMRDRDGKDEIWFMERIEGFHEILKGELNGEVNEKVASVICRFVSLVSALCGVGFSDD